jgi:5-formyltetrahydrofolate cyclo-ligase
MNSASEEKKYLRKIFKDKRAALTKNDVAKSSELIFQNFITNLLPKIYDKNSKKKFSLYLSSQNEVSTSDFAKYFYDHHIHFCYPKIIALNHHLDFISSYENQNFEANKFFPKILEPKEGQKVLPNFIILPLLAFDSELSRLGMGGGFFDRTIEYLKTQKLEIITIGLAYDFQRADSILPIENSDQRLDFIVTETNIFSASQTCVNLRQ